MANTTIILPPQFITQNNHGGYVLITAALLMTWSLLFWIIRVAVRYGYNNYFAADDVTATIGTVLGCVQAIVVMLAVTTAGLGRRQEGLSSGNLHRTELLVFSSNLLFPLVLASAKIATSELIARLTRQSGHLIACRLLSVATAVWGLVALLSIAIGCHSSRPWDMVARCSNMPTKWIAIGIFDILTELCLFLLPLVLIWPLQMPRSAKGTVLIAFGSRLPLVAMIVLRLVSYAHIRHSTDYTFDLTIPAVFTQVEMHYSLLAMTIPCLRPFLKAFDTGTLATYAAQIEVGMGAPPSAEAIELETSQHSSRRWSSRRTSSLLYHPQRFSIISTETTTEKSAPVFPQRMVTAPEEHPRLGHTAFQAVTHVRRSDEGTMSADDASDRHIIQKTAEHTVRTKYRERRK